LTERQPAHFTRVESPKPAGADQASDLLCFGEEAASPHSAASASAFGYQHPFQQMAALAARAWKAFGIEEKLIDTLRRLIRWNISQLRPELGRSLLW